MLKDIHIKFRSEARHNKLYAYFAIILYIVIFLMFQVVHFTVKMQWAVFYDIWLYMNLLLYYILILSEVL